MHRLCIGYTDKHITPTLGEKNKRYRARCAFTRYLLCWEASFSNLPTREEDRLTSTSPHDTFPPDGSFATTPFLFLPERPMFPTKQPFPSNKLHPTPNPSLPHGGSR